MKIRLAQINPIVGNLEHNLNLIKDTIQSSASFDMVVFPELSLTGYPPQDLLLDQKFISNTQKILDDIVKEVNEQIVVIGFPRSINNELFNSAAVIQNNKILGFHDKILLPTYDVFDEKRYFKPSESINPITVNNNEKEVSIGIQICEDLWDDDYSMKVTDTLIDKGADIIINISASPYRVNILNKRIELCRDRLNHLKYYFIYCNLVGGQDELVFDGQSFVMNNQGEVLALGKKFKEDIIDFDTEALENKSISLLDINESEEMFGALSLGVRDYFKKSGFTKAVIGLSGGIDSSLTAAIAVDALGKENVVGISMPSDFSSEHSKADASKLSDNLGIEFKTISINRIYNLMLEQLYPFFRDTPVGLAEENLQARIRGNILMSVSNKINALVLSTGNKTELALGYCTIYGDMCGALSVISDINKLQVYAISKWINDSANMAIIPKSVIDKRPSAELRDNQYDPFDYNKVSPMVDYIINDLYDENQLCARGFDRKLIHEIISRIHISEYKRRQAPPGIKVSAKAFGIGRRYPINNQYRSR